MIFYELTNHLNSRGKFGSANDVSKIVLPNKEAYRSYFGYDETAKLSIIDSKKYKRQGKFFIGTIILDIDKGDESFYDLLNRVKKVVDRIISEFDLEGQFQIYFSGRGFHIHLPNIFGFEPSGDLPEIVKLTLAMHFPEADLMPVHKRGLIRLPGSMNLKTSLYKIPISEDEIWFLNEDNINDWASTNRQIELIKPNGWKTFPELIIFPKKEVANKTLTPKSSKPTRFVTCMQNLYNSDPIVGHRHESILRLSSWLLHRGIPLKGAIPMVLHWMGNEGGAKEVRIVNNAYEKGYEYSCGDHVMQQHCTPKCAYYKKKNYLTGLVSASETENDYANFITNNWKKNAINLAPILGITEDLHGNPINEFYVMPQDVVGIIGSSGLNKTAAYQNIATQLQDFGPVLYISTEFSNMLLGRRFSQIAHNMSKNDLEVYYQEGRHVKNPLSKKYDFVKFISDIPTMDGLEDLVRRYKPRVLMIDVIDDIIASGKRGTEGESEVGQRLKQIGMKYNHFTFYVHHIKKSQAYDEKGIVKPLTLDSGKGSSTIAQKSDIVFAIEGYGTEKFRVIRSLKQRDNPPVKMGYDVNMDTFRFSRDLTCNEIITTKKNNPHLS